MIHFLCSRGQVARRVLLRFSQQETHVQVTPARALQQGPILTVAVEFTFMQKAWL